MMRLVLLGLLLAVASAQRETFHGHQVWQLNLQPHQLETARSLERIDPLCDWWHAPAAFADGVSHADLRVPAHRLAEVRSIFPTEKALNACAAQTREFMRANDINYTVTIEDLEPLVQLSYAPPAAGALLRAMLATECKSCRCRLVRGVPQLQRHDGMAAFARGAVPQHCVAQDWSVCLHFALLTFLAVSCSCRSRDID